MFETQKRICALSWLITEIELKYFAYTDSSIKPRLYEAQLVVFQYGRKNAQR